MSAREELKRAYELVRREYRDAGQESYKRELTARMEAYAHALQILQSHPVVDHFQAQMWYDNWQHAQEERIQAEEQLEKREQARQEAEKRVDYWKGKYHHTCESEEDYKQRAEAAEEDATRLRGALRRLYRANSLKAPSNELADAMVQARDAVVCDQPEPRSEPDTAEGQGNGFKMKIQQALMDFRFGRRQGLSDIMSANNLDKLTAHLAARLSNPFNEAQGLSHDENRTPANGPVNPIDD